MTESQLEALLAEWAAAHRLSDDDIATIRARVVDTAVNTGGSLDADWLWRLLRPVTALLEQTAGPVAIEIPTRVFRHWPSSSDHAEYRPYLQLA